MNAEIYNILKIVLIVAATLPFLIESVIRIISAKYKKISANLGKTENQVFRAIKLRYTNSSKLGISVQDTHSYVIRCLCGKGGPLGRILTADRLCCLISCICLISGIAMGLYGHMRLALSLSGTVAAFYIFRQFCAIDYNTNIILSLTEDYLENTLSHRLNSLDAPVRKQASVKVSASESQTDTTVKEAGTTEADSEDNKTQCAPAERDDKKTLLDSIDISDLLLKNDNADIIEYVLQEYLA